MSALRRLGESTARLGSTYERLSSGQRINHASDDAAGLAVASALNVNARIHNQAYRDINDSISQLNIADGGTENLKSILLRLRELATQASNGTFSDAQRQASDREVQALAVEYNRIIETTKFNGTSVFDGTGLAVQAGSGDGAVLYVTLQVSTSTITPAHGDGTFQARAGVSTGTSPLTVAVGDVNGDSKPDLVSADYTSGAVSVLLGNGNGTFQARAAFSTGSTPFSVAIGDLNGDGKADLVSADYGSNTLSVLLGNGNGTFQARVAYAAGTRPISVAISDLNGDGKPDLVSADAQSNTVSVLLGNGNGTFQARSALASGSVPVSVAVGDLNGDGKPDLVSADYGSNAIGIFLGNGNGTFQARTALGASAPAGVAVADLNNDGKLDIVSADFAANAAGVYLGNGNGTFQARAAFGVGSGPDGIAVSDLNGDGKADLVSADRNSNSVSVLLGNGNGTFQARTALAAGIGPYSVAIGDLNADSKPDVVSADAWSNALSVFLANGPGPVATTTSASISRMSSLSVATRSSALAAQGQVDSYLENVGAIAGVIGSALSRLSVAARLAISVSEVTKAAESRITDVDVADETSQSLRGQILQQAASAILSQANQQPALALQLIK